MRVLHTNNFNDILAQLKAGLKIAPPVEVDQWQSQDVRDRPEMVSYEMQNVVFSIPCPGMAGGADLLTGCNQPWAEDHFLERISGNPVNPPPSHEHWPFATAMNAEHTEDGKFSHTYPERFWPKYAGEGEEIMAEPIRGVRYQYGDLSDVIKLLREHPFTRQAYLPVWFPEDTGATAGQRVPCTLGYHFMIRRHQLDCTYFIRSCDFERHFRDDVYLALRLQQHVVKSLEGITRRLRPGHLTMHIGSLHVFQGDIDRWGAGL